MKSKIKNQKSKILCVVLARAGSKGLPGKNMAEMLGRPLIEWTIMHARKVDRLDRLVVSTDGEEIAGVARRMGVQVVDRPDELATDTAAVDAAVRHAVEAAEAGDGVTYDAVVILYGNVPLRPADLTDRALEKLETIGCDSVQSVAPVGKNHPYWMKTLTGMPGTEADRIEPYQPNRVHRRQDLPPVYLLDGGIIAVTRESLFTMIEGDPHAFLGTDRRAIVTEPGEVVDVDTEADLKRAEALLYEEYAEEDDDADWIDEDEAEQEMMPIKIGGVELGGPAYIIAELGVNHDGSLDRALELTRAAKAAGADAVKLQLFDARHLLSAEAELAAYQEGSAADPYTMLDRLQLSAEEMLEVKNLAHELGLGFIVTCFSIELVDEMRRLDPDAVKVASPDAVNTPLIRALMELDKPLIVSTGACEDWELSRLQWSLRGRPVVLLHCVSAYPVPDDRARLLGIRRMGSFPSGYSDHTTDPHTGMLAAALGASVLEKHLTYDRAAAGPDHAASFDPRQFAEYVRLVRLAEALLGPKTARQRSTLDIERDVRRVSRQSVCAVRDLAAGGVVRREDVTVKRPGTGIAAAWLDDVIGKTLLRDVQANHLLHHEDIDL